MESVACASGYLDFSFRKLAENDAQRRQHLFAAADVEDDCVAGVLRFLEFHEGIGAGDLLAVELEDQVVNLQPRLFGWRFRADRLHLANFRILGHRRTEVRVAEAAAKIVAAPDFGLREPVETLAVGIDRDMDVGRDRPADTAVDADDSAAHIEQRPARIAADERAIGSQVVRVRIENPTQSQRRRPAVLKAARMAERQAPIALLKMSASPGEKSPRSIAIFINCS